MTTNPDFLGFTFNGVHSSTFNVYYVSKGNRYIENFSGVLKNNALSVQGYEGAYFYGTNIGKKTIILECAIDGATEYQIRGLQRWLQPGLSAQLTIDGQEYKYTTVVIDKAIKFSYIPFDGDTSYENIYRGNFSLTFVAFDPYSYSDFFASDDFQFSEDEDWYWESGVLFEDWSPDISYDWTSAPITSAHDIILYNGGNAPTLPIIFIEGTWAEPITFTNEQTNQTFTLAANAEGDDIIVNCELAQVILASYIDDDTVPTSPLNNTLHSGDFLQLQGTGLREDITISITNGASTATKSTGSFSSIDVGRFLFIEDEFHEIISVTSGIATIDGTWSATTDSYEAVVVDANVIAITGTSFSLTGIRFLYRYKYY